MKVDNIVIAGFWPMIRHRTWAMRLIIHLVFSRRLTVPSVDKTIAEIDDNLGKSITTQEYDGLTNQINALYNNEVGCDYL